MVSSNLKEKLKRLPTTPGVYIYEDSGGEIIYVGKAKNLKSRVSSYFGLNLNKNSKTFALVENIHDLRTIEVESELEALILEAELIKKHQETSRAGAQQKFAGGRKELRVKMG